MYIIKFVEKSEYERSIQDRTEDEIKFNHQNRWYGREHKYLCESQEDTFALWFQLTRGGTNDGCKPTIVRVFSDDMIEFDLNEGIPFKPK